MTDFTAHALPGQRSLVSGIADFFAGLARGYRAYRTYTILNAKSDSDLTAMGLTRMDLPRIAASEILQSR